jgi:hypothetical protein
MNIPGWDAVDLFTLTDVITREEVPFVLSAKRF